MSLANQSVYVAQAQAIQGLWNQFQALYFAVNRISELTAKNGAQAAWKAMATAAQKPDGSISATPDANLNMTASDIINALNDMTMLCSVFDGTLAPAAYSQVDHRGDAPSVASLTQ